MRQMKPCSRLVYCVLTVAGYVGGNLTEMSFFSQQLQGLILAI